MTINYIEKGHGLHEAVRAAGYRLSQRFPTGQWESSNDAAVQAIIDAYDPLPYAKQEKRAAIKADGLTRIQAVFPAISDFDILKLVVEIMTSIAPAARQLTANMTTAQQIWTAGQNALTAVNAATSVDQVNAVTPNWP